MSRAALVLFLAFGAVLPACFGGSKSEAETGQDTDTDTDADADTDTDADTDADTDTLDGYTVTMETSHGTMVILLDPVNAPITVENFVTYVDEGFYDGSDGLGATTFHRVMEGFMIQGGGYTVDGTLKATHDPIVLEADNGLSNLAGTIAMARTSSPDSATTQFFINHVDNLYLDSTGANDGYAVFGALIDGLEVVDTIAALASGGSKVPSEDVVITSVTRD
jgi:cyclophilin family peptidyl-prolyl cis-trans isomerase